MRKAAFFSALSVSNVMIGLPDIFSVTILIFPRRDSPIRAMLLLARLSSNSSLRLCSSSTLLMQLSARERYFSLLR